MFMKRNLTPKDMMVAITKIHPKPGDIICVRMYTNLSPEKLSEFIMNVRKLLHNDPNLKDKGCTVMFMKQDVDFSLLPENEMNKAGWYRKEKKCK